MGKPWPSKARRFCRIAPEIAGKRTFTESLYADRADRGTALGKEDPLRGFALVFAFTVMLDRPVGAATPCAVDDWLTDLYLQSRALQEAASDGRADPHQIRAVADALGRQPGPDVSRLLDQNGLQRDRAQIIRFIDAQNATLAGTGSARDLRDATRHMARILANRTCDDDPGARPGVDRFASAVTGIAPNRVDRPSARRDRGLLGSIVQPTDLGIVAALLTLVGVGLGVLIGVAYSRNLRRIERRSSCSAGFHAYWQNGSHDGHFVDISRRGCKLRLDHQLRPHTTLTIDTGILVLAGRVAWSNAHYCGVLFSHRLDDQTLRSFLKQSRALRNRSANHDLAPVAPVPP